MTIHRFDRFVRKAAAAKWRLLNVGNRTWAAEAGDFADGRRRRGRQPACECSGAGPRPELSVLFGVISRCNGARQWHGVEAVRTGRSKRRLAPSSTMPDGDQPARRGRPARKLPSCRGAPGHDRPDLANPQQERRCVECPRRISGRQFRGNLGLQDRERGERVDSQRPSGLARPQRADQSPKG
jgi:hypothetical protein